MKTPYSSIIDLEDPDINHIKIRRFYKHANDWQYYVECDARYAAKKLRNITEDDDIVQILSSEPESKSDGQFYRRVYGY